VCCCLSGWCRGGLWGVVGGYQLFVCRLHMIVRGVYFDCAFGELIMALFVRWAAGWVCCCLGVGVWVFVLLCC